MKNRIVTGIVIMSATAALFVAGPGARAAEPTSVASGCVAHRHIAHGRAWTTQTCPR